MNGKGELRLHTSRPIPPQEFVLLTAMWEEGVDDPIYSEGTFRARVRIDGESTEAGIVIRSNGSLDAGFNTYAFNINPSQRGGEYCISPVENTAGVEIECVAAAHTARPRPFPARFGHWRSTRDESLARW